LAGQEPQWKLHWLTGEVKSYQRVQSAVAIFHSGEVLILGGCTEEREEYENRILKVNPQKKTVHQGRLILPDMFYYTQVSQSIFGRNPVAVMGKQHIHYFDNGTMEPTSVLEEDGDFPE
jgi:hypothetical protein